MKNYVRVSRAGIIEVGLHGDQTAKTIMDLGSRVEPRVSNFRLNNKKILVLANLREIGRTKQGSDRAAVRLLDALPYDKLAILDGKKELNSRVRLIMLIIGQPKKMRLFDTRKSAIAWLML